MKKKKFILGLGAQKAGTSWLYNYFNSRDDFFSGFMKEYHIFDAPKHGKIFQRFLLRSISKMIEEKPKLWSINKDLMKLSMFINIDNYYNYFRDNMIVKEKIFSADITPAYAHLKKQDLLEIKQSFERRDIKVIPVFLMRDPVDRLRSLAKMKIGLRDPNKKVSKKRELQEMKKIVGTKEDLIRSNYSSTHREIKEAFGKDAFFSLYENLFNSDEIKRLCELIEIPFEEPNFSKKVNQASSKNHFSNDELSDFPKIYREQYKFAIDIFGESEIKKNWKSYSNMTHE